MVPQKLTDWLETHWVAPAYVGWVLMGLAAFFFAAATNTLAGWLYVMSGVLLGLLLVAAILPPRNLAGIAISREPIRPVTAGSSLLVELKLTNTKGQRKSLLQVQDQLPPTLADSVPVTAIAALPAGGLERWVYEVPTRRRGLYHWDTVVLRTAAPLGLFWCRRNQAAKAAAVVYPEILPLRQCALVDQLGEDAGYQWRRERTAGMANEGVTRTLRPYRWGDPIRLIHWRTTARYGELRVRELENVTAGQQVVIALNTTDTWEGEAFEQAVIAAASLFTYAHHRGFETRLWLPETGLLSEKTAILTQLAIAQPAPDGPFQPAPTTALIWLTMRPQPIQLPAGSSSLVWSAIAPALATNQPFPVVAIEPETSLQIQLETLP